MNSLIFIVHLIKQKFVLALNVDVLQSLNVHQENMQNVYQLFVLVDAIVLLKKRILILIKQELITKISYIT